MKIIPRERTQDEVVAHYHAIESDDFLGFGGEVLLTRLDAEHLAEFAKPDADLSEIHPLPLHVEAVMKEMADYMAFAWTKVEDHRGISAGRSVEKISEFAWLLGADEVVAAMEAAEYPQYGAPKLAVACEAFDLPIPDSREIHRMIDGLPCNEYCDEGCGM